MLTNSVLVPGMCAVGSAVYPPLISELESIDVKGFKPFDLRSVDPSELLLPNPLEADVAALRVVLTEYIESKGLDIVLVAHSYGGVVSLLAAAGLWKSTREKQGKKGGVAKIALIAAAIPLPGQSVSGARQEYQKQFGGIEDPSPDVEQTEKVGSHKASEPW
jgi:pimeloyl-ACP methyl ester carboxylesterase